MQEFRVRAGGIPLRSASDLNWCFFLDRTACRSYTPRMLKGRNPLRSEEPHDHHVAVLGTVSGLIVALLLWSQLLPPALEEASGLALGATSRATQSASSPIAVATPSMASATPIEPTVRLLFTGDINPGRCLAEQAIGYDDFTIPYKLLASELSAADITVGSLDGSISDLAPPEPCPEHDLEVSNLIGPARTVEGLASAGFDVLTVATNHALDCGTLGWGCDGQVLAETRRNLNAEGIQPVGMGTDLAEARKPVIIERQGVRFAFLGVNAVSGEATWAGDSRPGTAPLSDEAIRDVAADIAAARRQADVVIVLPHWGVEYEQYPQSEQRAWAAALIDAGADLVIGNHAHVIQPVETFAQGGVVAYALGNFVFDQGALERRQGVVFEAIFRGSKLVSWRLMPILINTSFQPRWATPAEAAEILGRVEAATESLISH